MELLQTVLTHSIGYITYFITLWCLIKSRTGNAPAKFILNLE